MAHDHDEHPPADLMAIYLACDEAEGDTDELIAEFAAYQQEAPDAGQSA